MSSRNVVVTPRENLSPYVKVTVTPTEVRIKVPNSLSAVEGQVVEEIMGLVQSIPASVASTLRGDFRYADGLMHLTDNAHRYGYKFYDHELQSAKFKGQEVFGTAWTHH